ncbi:hypothetical protein JD292_08235 [Leucobacter sp. CSA2]|uniref:Uncharacterized protein n=1 Tax=Leucobacter edaphi TaxID=2796472 RepID=A0A934UXW0_9MICO|nr:hypothetical protein [Leucobacter edaphi]MBK0422061.1 hypothetical protein [Leucobacter edaphi]
MEEFSAIEEDSRGSGIGDPKRERRGSPSGNSHELATPGTRTKQRPRDLGDSGIRAAAELQVPTGSGCAGGTADEGDSQAHDFLLDPARNGAQ